MLTQEERTLPLSIKLLIILPLITVIFWIASTLLGAQYLKSNIWTQFTNSNTRLLRNIGNQSARDIHFADYFNIRRMLQEYYDANYMSYLAMYTDSMNPLGISPPQLAGEDFLLMEDEIKKLSNQKDPAIFFKVDGKDRFHFQYTITDEEGVPLGYIAMGGTTAHLNNVVDRQIWSFFLLGLIVLVLQIAALIYFVNLFTRPLRTMTNALLEAEHKEPDEIIPTLIEREPKIRGSSEVHLFHNVYKHLLQEIQKHQDTAKQMAIHSAIGKVASHIAHDMRSPLSVIKSALDPSITKDEDKKLLLTTGRKSTNKLDQMADDLLDYAKARQVEKQPTDIMKIVHDTINETSQLVKKKFKIVPTGPKSLVAMLDSHRMNRVLTNLLTNAIQAIDDDGVITLEVQTKGKDLNIMIHDNGKGIPPEHLPHIFESTFTFGKQRGTGLGLTYVKNVIEAHDGIITADSNPAEGTTFHVEIPNCITTMPAIEENEVSTHATGVKTDAKGKRILVMDDEEELLVCWRVLLKEATGRVPMEIKAPEKLLESNLDPKSIDMAIVDYEFIGSDLNGLDVLEYLKRKGIKALYLCTAYYQDKDIQAKAKKIGIKGIIPKPIPDGILQKIL